MNVVKKRYDFFGIQKPPVVASVTAGPWCSKLTAATGAPTVLSSAGAMVLTLEATAEVQNACLYFGDDLCFNIDRLISVDFNTRISASLPAQVTASFGLAAARNDTPTSMAAYCLWQYAGSNVLKALSSDGTNTTAAISTGLSDGTTSRKHTFDFGSGVTSVSGGVSTGGKTNVQLAADTGRGNLQPVLRGTLFNLAAYTSGFQLFAQIQKTNNAAVGTLSIDSIELTYRLG